MSARVLVTGGSGFIGTNLVRALLDRGCEVLSLDIKPPQNPAHAGVYREVDILDREALLAAFREFRPQQVLHLAARTDLEGADLEDYAANTAGTEHLCDGLEAAADSVQRCVFVSTKLVCRNDYAPKTFDEYCPDTVYGRSKMVFEQIVKRRGERLPCAWCITRPTGIWGPWFDQPYRSFFQMVARGRYVHPGGTDAPKSFGYVGNVVHQMLALLDAPRDAIHRQSYYLSDYAPMIISEWANCISRKTRGRRVYRVPGPAMQVAAKIGDLLKLFGLRNPPVTSFRLHNMQADTSRIPLENMRELTGPLPYDMPSGVEETLAWMRRQGLIENRASEHSSQKTGSGRAKMTHIPSSDPPESASSRSQTPSGVDLSSFSPKDYNRGASRFTEAMWHFVRALVFFWMPGRGYAVKRFTLRLFGAKVGRNVVIKPRVLITMPWRLSIGDNSWIGEDCHLLSLDRITIEDNVALSQRVFLCTGNHDYTLSTFDLRLAPITIRRGAWLTAGTIVGPGVTVGEHAVLTIGSVTTQDLQPYGIYRGNPAEKISERKMKPNQTQTPE